MKKLTLLMTLILCGMAAYGQERLVVAPIENRGSKLDAAAVINLQDYLINAFINTGRYEVVDRNALALLTSEQKFQLSDWADSKKSAEMGKVLNANAIVRAIVMHDGEVHILAARILNVNTADALAAGEMEFTTQSDARGKMEAFAGLVIQNRGGSGIKVAVPVSTPATTAPASKPAPATVIPASTPAPATTTTASKPAPATTAPAPAPASVPATTTTANKPAPATVTPASTPARTVTIPVGFVQVAGGTFLMGSNNGYGSEKPVHSVTVKSFYMATYEVTQKEWREVMGTTVRQQYNMLSSEEKTYSWNKIVGEGDTYPMYYVNWYEAVEYCNRRSIKEGLTPAYLGSGDSITCDWSANGYRLPTEAEWEFAAKGGGKDRMVYEYSGSNSIGSVAWYEDNSAGTTHPVGTKNPNSLGIYDMSGNVSEWCWDWYGAYSSSSQTDPRGASSGSVRVRRGGSWSLSAVLVRSAYRGFGTPSDRYHYLGFRLVRP